MKNKRLIIILGFIALLLLIPLIAMQFTKEISWSTIDFIVMGSMLLSFSLLGDLALRKLTSTRNRIVAIVIILLLFFLVWAELAVGIIGTPLAGS